MRILMDHLEVDGDAEKSMEKVLNPSHLTSFFQQEVIQGGRLVYEVGERAEKVGGNFH
jgi:hypothetical protein